MNPRADFYGVDFEAEYVLFADDFEDLPGIYVVYTEKVCLDIGQTEKLKTAIEAHENTGQWVKVSGGDEIYVAFHFDPDGESRNDLEKHLRLKMHPICKAA